MNKNKKTISTKSNSKIISKPNTTLNTKNTTNTTNAKNTTNTTNAKNTTNTKNTMNTTNTNSQINSNETFIDKQEIKTTSILLANLIFIFHCLVVLFVLFAPFTNIPSLFILHITFCFSLMVHWYSNSNVCSLSIMESYLRGDSRENTFTHQFIAPIYDISDSEWNYIVWIVTIIVLLISIYKLYNSEKLKIALECYRETQPEGSKFMHFINCFKPLFII
jgi:hypothetical protein